MPSVQLSQYFELRGAGIAVESAAEQTGIGLTEARLWEEAVASGEASFSQPLTCARAPAREDEPQTKETSMEDVTTSIRVNDGPEVSIDLSKDISDPANSAASEQISTILPTSATDTGQRLKLFIERAERLDEEIKDLNSDKSELFKEMKSDGFDTPTIKRIIKLRKMEPHERQEAEAMLQTYMSALGMTPIEAAIALAA